MTAIHAIAHHSPQRVSKPANYSSSHWVLEKLYESIEAGAAVVTDDAELILANPTARQIIEQCETVELINGILQPKTSVDQQHWLKKLADTEVGSVALHRFDNTTGIVALTGIACPPTYYPGKLIMITFSRAVACPENILTAWGKEVGLTRCEARILKLLTDGLDVKEISKSLNNSEHTVRTHVRRILDKSGVRSMRVLLRRLALMPCGAIPASYSSEIRPIVGAVTSGSDLCRPGVE